MAFAYPPDWTDDERMNVLFLPFKDRNSNPNAFDSKLKFWKGLILEYLNFQSEDDSTLSENTIVISIHGMMKHFTRKGKSPKCLATVIQEMVKDSTMVDIDTLAADLLDKTMRQRASWSSWGYQVMVGSPLRKLSGRLMAAVSPKSPTEPVSRYIVKDMLQDKALGVLKAIRLEAESNFCGSTYRLLLTDSAIKSMFSQMNAELLDLILLWLESEYHINKTRTEDDIYIYKFSEKSGKTVEAISKVELGVVKIQNTKELLDRKINIRQKQCSNLVKEIKKQLAVKNKLNARRLLIRKKGLEKAIETDMSHVQKLESVLDEIFTADSNQVVLAAYESGSKTLKTLNDGTSLKTVNSAMDNLSEQVAASQDINDALASPIADDDLSSDADLEAELNDILAGSSNSTERHISDDNELLTSLDNLTIEGHKIPSDVAPVNRKTARKLAV